MNDSENVNDYGLADNVLYHLVKLMQLALLTGTDISDLLRLIRLEQTQVGELDLTREYEARFDQSIKDLEKKALAMLEEAQAEDTLDETPQSKKDNVNVN